MFSSVSDPAAGALSDFPLITWGEVEVLLMSFNFVTDANAANRLVSLALVHDTVTIQLASAGVAQTASTDFDYIAHQNAVTNAAGNVGTYMLPLPFLRMHEATPHIQINVANIQVGDQISDIRVATRTWRTAR